MTPFGGASRPDLANERARQLAASSGFCSRRAAANGSAATSCWRACIPRRTRAPMQMRTCRSRSAARESRVGVLACRNLRGAAARRRGRAAGRRCARGGARRGGRAHRPLRECRSTAWARASRAACWRPQDAAGWVVALGDMPWIEPSTIARVAAAIADGAAVAAPFHRGAARASGGLRRRLLRRAVGADRRRRCEIDRRGASATASLRIDVDDAGTLRDVDRPSDLA